MKRRVPTLLCGLSAALMVLAPVQEVFAQASMRVEDGSNSGFSRAHIDGRRQIADRRPAPGRSRNLRRQSQGRQCHRPLGPQALYHRPRQWPDHGLRARCPGPPDRGIADQHRPGRRRIAADSARGHADVEYHRPHRQRHDHPLRRRSIPRRRPSARTISRKASPRSSTATTARRRDWSSILWSFAGAIR